MKKPLFKKVCIVGVGLIGGSLGLAIRKRKIAKFVVGVVRRKSSAISAVERKAVNMTTLDFPEGVRGADLIILAGPIPTIITQIKQIGKGDPAGRHYVQPDAIIIDVGSSKAEIEQTAKKYLKKNIFVGCHPMAGSEKCGIEFANENLFQDAICFVTRRNEKVEKFWKALGSKVICAHEKVHDVWAAKSSHLPHALSFSLFRMIEPKFPQNPSLRDMARLAKSSPQLWSDIFLSNREQVLKAAKEFQKNFFKFQKALQTKDRKTIIAFIKKANPQPS